MVAIVTFMYAVIFVFMPYQGDDLGYLSSFRGPYGSEYGYYSFPIDYFPRWVANHWVYVNGRSLDKLMVFFFQTFPHWVVALFSAATLGCMMVLAIKCVGFPTQSVTGSLLLLSTMIFGYTWWDSFFIYAVLFNYMWVSAFVLGLAYLFYYRPDIIESSARPVYMLICLLAVLAGASHETAGPPLVAASRFGMFLNGSWRNLTKRRGIVALCALGGALLCILSPSAWMRFLKTVDIGTANDVWYILLLKSSYIALLLFLCVIIAALSRKGRKEIQHMLGGTWGIFTLAALFSCCVCAIGGIIGRSGWAANVFATIALFMWGANKGWHIKRHAGITISSALSGIILMHLGALAIWQIKLSNEYDEALRLYEASADGTVYLDVTPDSEAPWWLLNKPRGVPDYDDVYLLHCLNHYYSHGSKSLRLLPEAVKSRAFDSDTDIGSEMRVMTVKPQTEGSISFENEKVEVAILDGRRVTVTPFTDTCGQQRWLSAPLVLDPGDRLNYE